MHTRRRFRASFFAVFCAFTCACGGKGSSSPASSELGLVFGHVRTEDGSELQKVTVRAGDRSVETDRRGNFQIKVEPGEEQRIAVDSREFAGGQALLKLDKGSKASVELGVMKVRSFKVMDAEKGGRFEDDEGFAIELPKQALRLADDGVATGEAEIRYATVRDPTLMRVPPELKDERDVQLSSKGLLEVRFYQGSDPLTFKGEAKIEVPLPPESGLSGGERIRLYHYDEQSRRFKQEGEAAISEDQKWVATVDKFSWWAAAEPIADTGCVSAELRAGGDPAAGVLITATGRGGALWSASALTEADGRACIEAPASAELTLAAFWTDGEAESRWSHDALAPEGAGMCGGDACTDLGAQPLDGAEGDAGAPSDDAGVSSADGGATSDDETLFYVVNATPNGFSGFITTLRLASDGTLSTEGQRTMGVGRPLSMTGSPDGRFLYVPSTRGPILTFAVDATTGALSQLGEGVAAEEATQEVAVDPTGRFLYAANFTGRSVSMFSFAAEGLLVSEGSVTTGGTATALVIDPDLRFVFVANRDTRGLSSFMVDQSSGQLTPLEVSVPTGTGRPNDLVETRDGRFLFVQLLADASIVGYEIGSSGTLTAIDPPTALPGVARLALHPTLNVLYATSGGTEPNVSSFSIEGDGRLSALGSALPIGDGAGRMLIDPSGRFAFVLNTLSNDISTYTIESSGELSAGPLYEAGSLSNPQDGVFVPVGP
jgi:6-phosphogluconolactonase (cycloisomerase 2 family)